MGRKLKYKTPEEKRIAQRKWQMEHYYRNSEEIKRKDSERYREKKRKEFYDKKVQDLYRNIE